MLLSELAYQKIDRELAKFPAEQKRSAIMAALAIAQDEQGWVSVDVIRDVADYLQLPAISIQEVASFYDMFDTKPVGRYKITVCTNLPCALRDGVKSAEYLKEKLGIDFNETTADGLFSLAEGECMGSCGDAPVMLVNNKHMCVHMQAERIDVMLAELKQAGDSA
ncbi:MAG: NADH-quinone oxidoreductase subunit NuoE [Burkholderiaceae bacterium]|nr:NADH-quinone oxidoreductase subunit NuoE [Burkholderiaceae bacterium]